MTKKLCLVSLMFLIIFSGCSSKYNTNPDNSNKIIEIESAVDSSIPLVSVNQLVREAELIVVGTVTGKKTEESISIEPEAAKMIKNKVPNAKTENIGTTIIDQIKIDEVIYGSYDEKFVKVVQFGEAELKKGKKVVCILKKDLLSGNGDNYMGTCGDNSIFKLDESEKLMSFTSNMTVAKYDKRSLSLLKEDLKKSIKLEKNE